MLKMIARTERTGETAGGTEGPHELKWTAKVLLAEFVVAEESPADAHIEREQFVLPTERDVERHERDDPAGFLRSTEHSGRGKHSSSEDPSGSDLPFPRKSGRDGKVGLLKIHLMFFSNGRAPAQTASDGH